MSSSDDATLAPTATPDDTSVISEGVVAAARRLEARRLGDYRERIHSENRAKRQAEFDRMYVAFFGERPERPVS